MKPTERLHELGQSLWLDNITRPMLREGVLEGYIRDLSVTGLTSNPSIFDKAISGGDAYDEQIAELAPKAAAGEGVGANEQEKIFFELALADLRDAADLFADVHRRTAGVDGFVSLEVSPLIADDAAATIEEAKALHAKGERDNLFIKIPGTEAGREAIEESIFAGIPINVTLLFDDKQYLGAADAYMRGIERRIEAGLDPNVASVASLFISRWDVAVGKEVPDRAGQPARDRDRRPRLPRLQRAAGVRPHAAPDERGRAAAAAALGQHRDQGPRRLRHPLHRGLRLAASRSTRCPSRRCTRSPTTARSPTSSRKTAATPSRCWPSSTRPGSTSPRWRRACRWRAKRASTRPGKSC